MAAEDSAKGKAIAAEAIVACHDSATAGRAAGVAAGTAQGTINSVLAGAVTASTKAGQAGMPDAAEVPTEVAHKSDGRRATFPATVYAEGAADSAAKEPAVTIRTITVAGCAADAAVGMAVVDATNIALTEEALPEMQPARQQSAPVMSGYDATPATGGDEGSAWQTPPPRKIQPGQQRP